MGTESQKLRAEGNKIYLGLNDDLAPIIRRSRIEECLKFYNKALASAYSNEDKTAALKNLGMASFKMLGFYTQQGEEGKLINYSFLEALRYFTGALNNGSSKPLEWQRFLREKMEECTEMWIDNLHQLNYKDRIGAIEKIIHKIPSCASTEINLELADALFKIAVNMQESGNFKECLRCLHEAYRPLEEAKLHCIDMIDPAKREEIEVLEEDVKIQKCVAEAKQAIQTGDDLMESAVNDEESLNIEMIWEIVDWYQRAIISSRELELEVEAIACSRLGYVYDKILKLRERAKQRFQQCLTLVNALHPRVLTSEDWYKLARETLARYQEEYQRAEEEKWENKRKKYVEELEPELKELHEYCNKRDKPKHSFFFKREDLQEVLEFVYKRFPPKNKSFKMPTVDKKDETNRSIKDAYRKAATHYHPDRVKEEDGLKTKVLMEEICKELTRRYESLK